jgi:CDP-diglyceride synthetase
MIEYGGTLSSILVGINWAIAIASVIVLIVYSLRIARLVQGAKVWKIFVAATVSALVFVAALGSVWGKVEYSYYANYWIPLLAMLLIVSIFGYFFHSLNKEVERARRR